jgi:hydrogenase nickel incorporation protein HypA/HybF
MHELSVCLALMSQVERIATEHEAWRVEKIVLQIGPLSGIEPALLQNAFPLAAAGTRAEDADLVIEHSTIVVECTECGARTDAKPNRLICGDCGDFRTRMVSGEEMTLVSLELDLEQAPPDPGGGRRGAPDGASL